MIRGNGAPHHGLPPFAAGAPSCKTARMAYIVRFATTSEDNGAAFDLRRAVFEVEQNVPRPLDRDGWDEVADHVVVLDEAGRCVGTGRTVRLDSRTAQIGRMATAADRRGTGVGALVLEALERISRLRGVDELVVHAQLPAERFYRNRGFITETEPFEEQGVPHVRMRKHIALEADLHSSATKSYAPVA